VFSLCLRDGAFLSLGASYSKAGNLIAVGNEYTALEIYYIKNGVEVDFLFKKNPFQTKYMET